MKKAFEMGVPEPEKPKPKLYINKKTGNQNFKIKTSIFEKGISILVNIY